MLEEQKQRQLDWERQRKDQLILLRARHQNAVGSVEKEIKNNKKNITAQVCLCVSLFVGEYVYVFGCLRVGLFLLLGFLLF